MDEVRWLDPRELAAWRSLQFMQMRLTAQLTRDLAGSGLSYSDYVVLVALTDHDEGRLRQFELGRDLGWEKSRVSHQVRRMVERGLVAKEQCGADRRGAFVVVTEQGRQAIGAAAPGHAAAVRRLFVDRLTPDQLEVIGAAARSVLDGLEADEADGADEAPVR